MITAELARGDILKQAKRLWDEAAVLAGTPGDANLQRAVELMQEVVAIYDALPRGGADKYVAMRHLARLRERMAGERKAANG
ncbi:MAG TPA: hypothetical protein VFT22_27685 [Kofleriaceae bacterium]|nr:hypothetical protein [Kofleriaceae bacterium]